MSVLTFDPFHEFQKYLGGISFTSLLADPAYAAVSKKLHCRVLALLIVEHQLDIHLQNDSNEPVIVARGYLNEFRSDMLSSLLIFHMGLYKATLMSSRSGIENFFRVIAGLQQVDFRSCKSVFELIEMVKQSPLRKISSTFEQSLNVLLEKYSEYCNYVHSTGEDYLSLDRKLSDMPRWQEKTGTACADSIVKMIQAAISILLLLRPDTLRSFHPDQRDFILDALPKGIKSGLAKDLPV